MKNRIQTIEDTWPNGKSYKKVMLDGTQIGSLAVVEGGFKSLRWRQPVANLESAIEKLLTDSINAKQKEITRLHSEIGSLKSAKEKI